jgi:hypothetical protein
MTILIKNLRVDLLSGMEGCGKIALIKEGMPHATLDL